MLRRVLTLVAIFTNTSLLASDLSKAPPSFAYQNGKAVFVDFLTSRISYEFDTQSNKATAYATVEFVAGEAGFPVIDLVANASAIRLNGTSIPPANFQTTSDPNQATRLRVLKALVEENSHNTLEIEYSLGSDSITFSSGAARIGFFMSDLTVGGRTYWEQYGPANFEYDQFQLSVDIRVTGSNVTHEVYSNGVETKLGTHHWLVEFPEYFTASSIFLHLTDKARMTEQRYTFQGAERQIPVVVYSLNSSLVSQGVSRSRSVMNELEQTYGPFVHDKVVIYLTSSGGGMEYCGATVTSMGTLGHELTHSYFARGVMPSDGNSGWIDEAVASWRDDGYPRRGAPSRNPVNLGAFSPYRRHTTQLAYSSGALLMSEFDGMFQNQGGMKSILRTLFDTQKLQTITVNDFKLFLENMTGRNLNSIFNRYVYGRSSLKFDSLSQNVFENNFVEPIAPRTSHPRPYTAEEIRHIR
jgi:hypothetical protein